MTTEDKTLAYRLAELAGYEIHTVDIYGVVWVRCKKGKNSYRYIPEHSLELLMECVRSIPDIKRVVFEYHTDEDLTSCTLAVRIPGGIKSHWNWKPTETEALYVTLNEYLRNIE